MLRSIWLAVVLAVVSTTAWAQPAQPGAAVIVEKAAQTARAQQAAAAAQQKLTTVANQRVVVATALQQQLVTVDRLKKQKASWNRDRELNRAQADAADTAKRLTAIDNQIRAADQAVAKARAAVVVAIDAELAAGASGARAEQLAKLRTQVSPATPTKKIVIPNAEINPLADPEELESQIAALLAAEKQLDAQRKGLDQQHKELIARADLRSAHDRASDMATREDDTPHRGAQKPSSRGGPADLSAAQEDGAGGSQPTGAGSGSGGSPPSGDTSIGGESFGSDKHGGATGSFEQSTAIALGEVIDKSTIDGMLKASRSGDPKQRAQAAKLARDAVANQLKQLQQKRAAIEKRVKQLRKH